MVIYLCAEKAQKLCVENNAKTEDHFVESTEMVEVGSAAIRQVPSFKLTRYACLMIVEQVLSYSKKLDNCYRRSIRGIRQALLLSLATFTVLPVRNMPVYT